MPLLSHVRTPWNRERYTEAQAQELRQLRNLYTVHCSAAFGMGLPEAFALHTEGDDYQPRYRVQTLTPPVLAPLSPVNGIPGPYASFADSLLTTLTTFEERRRVRWFGKGHPNDPLRLLGVFLRDTCTRCLRNAATGEATLAQVTALRQYLESIAEQQVFRGDRAIPTFLHNLTAPLIQLERDLARTLRLQSAQDQCSRLQDGVQASLSQVAVYLFHVLAEKDLTSLPFSRVNLRAGVVDKKLSQALATREGLLLQQWASAQPSQLPPLLEAKGTVHSHWQTLFQISSHPELPIDAELKGLPLGVCSLLPKETIEAALHLHGLCSLLNQYDVYLSSLWQLAGFGGDRCVYDELQDAVTSILTEFRLFTQVFAMRLSSFQQELDQHYKKALADRTHAPWQANYRKAKAVQEQCLATLRSTEAALTLLLATAQDPVARENRRTLALEAHRTLWKAPRFLNTVRVSLGLAPQAQYPGLEVLSDPFAAPLPTEALPLQQALVLLLPEAPCQVTWLCRTTPATAPWTFFRGSVTRYNYLYRNPQLTSLSQAISLLEENPASPATSEKQTFLEQLSTDLRAEHIRLVGLRSTLTWPFHRTSIRFCATLQEGIAERLWYVEQQEQQNRAALAAVIVDHSAKATQMQPQNLAAEEEREQQEEAHRAFLLQHTTLLHNSDSVESRADKAMAEAERAIAVSKGARKGLPRNDEHSTHSFLPPTLTL